MYIATGLRCPASSAMKAGLQHLLLCNSRRFIICNELKGSSAACAPTFSHPCDFSPNLCTFTENTTCTYGNLFLINFEKSNPDNTLTKPQFYMLEFQPIQPTTRWPVDLCKKLARLFCLRARESVGSDHPVSRLDDDLQETCSKRRTVQN